MVKSINGDVKTEDELSNFNCFNYWRDPLPDVVEIEPKSDLNLGAYNNYFKSRSYAIGFTLSLVDFELFKRLANASLSRDEFPHLSRWHRHIKSYDVIIAEQILSMVEDLEPWLDKIVKLGEVNLTVECLFMF